MTETKLATASADSPHEGVPGSGPLGRWGAFMAGHTRAVLGVWLLVLVTLGAAAPSVFTSLAGAGWQANGSESVRARELAQRHFDGIPQRRYRW